MFTPTGDLAGNSKKKPVHSVTLSLPLSNCLSQIYRKYAKDLEQKMAANSFTSFYPSGLYTAKIVYSSVRLYTWCSVWCHLSCKLPNGKGTWHKAVRIWNQSTGHSKRTFKGKCKNEAHVPDSFLIIFSWLQATRLYEDKGSAGPFVLHPLIFFFKFKIEKMEWKTLFHFNYFYYLWVQWKTTVQQFIPLFLSLSF